mgnify:CR=1 FL=1
MMDFIKSSKINCINFLCLIYSRSLYILHHFYLAKGMQIASSLAFTSLLSFVPLLTVVFIFFSDISLLQNFSKVIQNFIFINFIPEFGQIIQDNIAIFLAKASQLTVTGSLLFVLVALMLLATIDNAFNLIWGVKKKRNPIMRLFIYFLLLLLGPLLIGIGIISTTYILSLPVIADVNTIFGIKRYVLNYLPFLTTFIVFILLYVLVPYCYVPKKNAALASVICTILFELAKNGFGVFIREMSSYENIYGALAVIPLFLIWIYISWVIILFGAHITFCLSSPNLVDDKKVL